MTKNNLKIKHNKGKAREAFAKNSQISNIGMSGRGLLNLKATFPIPQLRLKKITRNLNPKKETNFLKTKILKQLTIIDDVLNNPESINKIEDYDNPFSEGNFRNLQKVSNHAIELQKLHNKI